jgi:hypothetical protein
MATEPRPIHLALSYHEAVEVELALMTWTESRRAAGDPESAALAQRIRLEQVSPPLIRAERGQPDPAEEELHNERVGFTVLFAIAALIGYTIAGGLGIGISAAITTAVAYRMGWGDAGR